ncbi:RebB family R body protein [Chryseobacterium sp. T16E-39]|uniref:RebB family R body protein n=1 Tax=Chryseobacterium sp. T16E-39 TaxID=2015076 RepID=UPI001E483EA9|nr:RebB family R body protein [Chryseobacterium sp. T16E-39]
MNHAHQPQSAKISNLLYLRELNKGFSFQKEKDTPYFSKNDPQNNNNRFVFNLETSEIEAKPTIRLVHYINNNGQHNTYPAFVIELKAQSVGIAIVQMKNDESKNLHCHIDILPFNSLIDIAEPEHGSKILGVDTRKARIVLKMDIMISQSETGEALYDVHDVDVQSLEGLITSDEITDLKNKLESPTAKFIAHYIHEVHPDISSEYQDNTISLVAEGTAPQPSNDQLTGMLSPNLAAGSLALATLYQSMAHSTGIMFENAISNQNQQNALAQAAANQGVMQIYSLDTVADAISIAKMLGME